MAFLMVASMCLGMTACVDKSPEAVVTTTTTTTVIETTTTTVTTTTTSSTVAKSTVPTPTVSYPPVGETTCLLLVNSTHPLSSKYVPNLVKIPSKYLNGSLNQVAREMYSSLIAMMDAARADGVSIYVRSPYRSYSSQNSLFRNKRNSLMNRGMSKEEAEKEAARFIAYPGTSEHQSGLAVDFNVADSEFEQQPAFTWLKQHAAEYGFIMRYPAEKSEITGIIYEPWHWRYVGREAAEEINRLGLALEEYVELVGE